MKLNRRSFVAALAAAPVAGPAALAAPLGGPLRIPAGFVRGAAVPEGFDFRDAWSGTFMSFGLWYVCEEDGTRRGDVAAYSTPQEAYAAYLQAREVEERDAITWANLVLDNPDSSPKERARARNTRAWAKASLGEIEAAKASPVDVTKFVDVTKDHPWGVRIGGGNYMACSVVRGDMAYQMCVGHANDPEYAEEYGYAEDFARAQTDPNWDGQWGGGA